jgi:allantoin racemase
MGPICCCAVRWNWQTGRECMHRAFATNGAVMIKRLLVINPNTTEAMTRKVSEAATAALPGVEIRAVSGAFGARYISSRASYAIAAHAALDAFARHGAGCDTILLACFGDPGLEALREVSPVPVIGLVDAACHEAGVQGRRFAIVTGGARWGPMLSEMLRLRGLEAQLAGIRTVAPTGGQIAQDPEGSAALLAQTCRQCITQDGAQAVILGGAGLIGIAAMIQPDFDVPIICSNDAGLLHARRALQAPQPSHQPLALGHGTDPVGSIGLSPQLDILMSGTGLHPSNKGRD